MIITYDDSIIICKLTLCIDVFCPKVCCVVSLSLNGKPHSAIRSTKIGSSYP